VVEVLTQGVNLTIFVAPVAIITLLFVGDITITITIVGAQVLGIILIVPLWSTCNREVELMLLRGLVTYRKEIGLTLTLGSVIITITLPM
jgi:hypothetical protein